MAKTIQIGTVPKRPIFVGLLLLLLLTSCRTQTVVLPEVHQRDSLHFSVYTRADSIREYVRDSMSIRFGKVSSAGGNGIPDTVYIDRWHTAYKDRWHFRDHTDTVTTITRDSVPYPVEVPIEVPTPVPRFYVKCTIGFWLIILGFVLYWAIRIAKALYLHR